MAIVLAEIERRDGDPAGLEVEHHREDVQTLIHRPNGKCDRYDAHDLVAPWEGNGMEIEVGGEYRTNAGWRAVVLSKDAAGWHAVRHHVPGPEYETRRHDLDGKCITNGMYDLVAPWKAGDTRAATSNKDAPTVAISLGAGGWDVRCSGLAPEQVAAIVRHI
jgi:hypothetical protein